MTKLQSNDELTRLFLEAGINTWPAAMQYICSLPYGRNTNRADLSLVLKEQKGTCSSKHALLREVATLNKVAGVSLMLGIYKMNRQNTPGIGDVLENNGIEYIPEAHCYLKVDGKRIDLTSPAADFKRIEKDLLEEQEIEPRQVADYKIKYHKRFLQNWLEGTRLDIDFGKLWTIRENCIKNLE